MRLNLAQVAAPSFANGPGARMVIWVQGCTLRCPGCHNPHTWDGRPLHVIPVEAVLRRYVAVRGLRGITLSGGEPFEQAPALACLAAGARELGGDVVCYTGFAREALDRLPDAADLLAHVDLLVDGPYIASLRVREPLRGSSNQRFHFLGGRIGPDEVRHLPVSEWIGGESGGVATGIGMRELARALASAGAGHGG